MIKLCVDESYAFEYYCILLVKYQKLYLPELISQIKIQKQNLISQIGEPMFNAVCSSDEFKKMIETNIFTFDMVDKAKENLVKASEVDKCSLMRKQAKDALQEKFFSSHNLETKMGYGD